MPRSDPGPGPTSSSKSKTKSRPKALSKFYPPKNPLCSFGTLWPSCTIAINLHRKLYVLCGVKGGGIRTSGHGSPQDCVKYAQLLGRTECCTRRRWYCGPGHLELTQRHKAHYDDDQLDYGQKGKQCWPTSHKAVRSIIFNAKIQQDLCAV